MKIKENSCQVKAHAFSFASFGCFCGLGLAAMMLWTTITGCTPLKQYYTAGIVTNRTDTIANVIVVNAPQSEGASNFVFSIIEYDDQGELWDSRQLSNTVSVIEGLRTTGYPVSLITFVHGWNNDASHSTSNLKDFRVFIKSFAQVFSEENAAKVKTNGLPRYVVGVFLAWRGKSSHFVPPTFWSRKNTASRVAGVDCADAMLSLIASTRSVGDQGKSESKAIIIGHSFGGLIVEQALTKPMLGSMLLNAPSDEARRKIRKNAASDRAAATNALATATNQITNNIWCETTNLTTHIKNRTGLLRDKRDEIQRKLSANEVELKRIENDLKDPKGLTRELGTSRERIKKSWRSILGTDERDWIWQRPPYEEAVLFRLAVSIMNEDARARNHFVNRIDWNNIKSTLVEINTTNNFDEAITSLLKTASQVKESLTDGVALSEQSQEWEKHYEALVSALKNEMSESGTIVSRPVRTAIRWEADKGRFTEAVRTGESELKTAETNLSRSTADARDEHGAARNALITARKDYSNAVERILSADRSLSSFVDPDRPPADLILLVNPATEALTAKSMVRALQENRYVQLKNRATDPARPWIISVSSQGGWLGLLGELGTPGLKNRGDSLTEKLFPIGRRFSSTFKQFRDYTNQGPHKVQFAHGGAALLGTTSRPKEQEKFFLHTAPQTEALWNRTAINIDYSANPVFGEVNFTKLIRENIDQTRFSTGSLKHAFFSTNDANKAWVLEPRFNPQNESSYWIFSVDPSIIPEHGNIFKPNLIALTAALYRMSQANPSTDAAK